MRLPRWSFMSRFRLRIMFQNVANYLILFVGIFFIMVMLAMAVGMPDTLDYYKKNTDSMMFANTSTYSNPMSMQTETCLKPTTVMQRNLT